MGKQSIHQPPCNFHSQVHKQTWWQQRKLMCTEFQPHAHMTALQRAFSGGGYVPQDPTSHFWNKSLTERWPLKEGLQIMLYRYAKQAPKAALKPHSSLRGLSSSTYVTKLLNMGQDPKEEFQNEKRNWKSTKKNFPRMLRFGSQPKLPMPHNRCTIWFI